MAKAPQWLPHPGGRKRRGLDVKDGVLQWAACNQGDVRRESIFVNQSGLDFKSSDLGIVTASYGIKPEQGAWPVNIDTKGTGYATVTATGGDGSSAVLEVNSYEPITLSVKFKNVRTDAWTSTFGASKAVRLIKNANYIYSYQGNIHFSMKGDLTEEYIPGLGAIVPTNDITKWGKYRDCAADVTVFFVKENDALGVNWKDLIMMEDSQPYPYDEMTFAHELGHRMGLPHPSPPLSFNLMNQTAVGDRHRLKIFLTRKQIETIRDPSKWKHLNLADLFECLVHELL